MTVAVVCPAAKLTVPLGNAPPTKSVPLAGLGPLPVTAHAAEAAPVLVPVRVTVKVKGVLPLLPSDWYALLAAIDKVAAVVEIGGVVVAASADKTYEPVSLP